MSNTKNLIAITVIAILSLSAIYNPYSQMYINQLKDEVRPVTSKRNQLYEQIEEVAEQYQIDPQDAKIDQIWKATPGYNGIKVDIEASYEKMKKGKEFDEHKLVFVQVPPTIHLEDLSPAPIFRGHPEKPMVSFLINVAWGNEYLPSMLATLKENKIHATFFLEGRWVKENPDLAKMIVDGGHEVGNHSYSHPNMQIISAEKIREEITKTNEIIEATTGKKVIWFGPPSGAYRDETIQIAHSLHLKTVLWTVDTIDWKNPTPSELIQRVLTKVHSGAMILMHPTKSTEQALDQLITEIKAKNLRISTVSKLMDEERIIKMNETETEKQD